MEGREKNGLFDISHLILLRRVALRHKLVFKERSEKKVNTIYIDEQKSKLNRTTKPCM